MILSDRIEGEARDVGKALAGIGLQVVVHGQPLRAPCVLLSGGETTVTLRGNGRGGRNVEFLLALALALQRRASIYALAADTDGVDGAEEVAGAFVTPDTLERARIRGRDPARDLERNDAHAFFAALDDRIVTGPTRTNVNDFRAIVVMAP
jgi:hydroxypyruvate reductase